MSFSDKVILITGASSGIGADAARHLAKLNGKIALVGRNEKRLNDVADQIKAAGSPEPLVIVADVTKDAQRIIDETIKHFGKLNILINSAGILSHSDYVNTVDMNEFDQLMNTNVRSVIELTKFAIPHLERTKGNILNVSSSVSLRIEPSLSIYSVTKAAVDQFTKCAALDLASKGIRVNAINPALTRTPLFETSGTVTDATATQFFDGFAKIFPAGRVGEVADMSNAIEFLVKDSSSFLTGLVMPVDGGRIIGDRY